MAKLESVGDNKREHRTTNVTTQVEFQRKEGIKYCLSCGSECPSEDESCSCGKDEFLPINISEIIGGYLEKSDKLKKYYHKHYNVGSIVMMNNKRIIYYLMIHKHKINIDKKVVDLIYKVNNIQQRKE